MDYASDEELIIDEPHKRVEFCALKVTEILQNTRQIIKAELDQVNEKHACEMEAK